MKKLQSVFTKEYLAKLESLSFALKRKMGVEGYSGGRRSLARGSSLEFSDFRDYIPGDDLRRVDWNSYARFGRLNTKLYFEEKQAEVNIFLDASRSMGSGGKFLQAKAMAASLAYVALCDGERVNVFVWNQKIVLQKRNIVQKRALLQILQLLEQAESGDETDPTRAVLLSGQLGRGISVIVSDFLTENTPYDAVRVLQDKKQEVLLLQVLSKEEEKPEISGTVRLTDSENKEVRDIELTAMVLAAYEKALKEHKSALANFCKSRGASFHTMLEDDNLFQQVRQIVQ